MGKEKRQKAVAEKKKEKGKRETQISNFRRLPTSVRVVIFASTIGAELRGTVRNMRKLTGH